MKAIIKLTPINQKGFNFVKLNGSYHGCKIKGNKVILKDKNNKKVIIKPKDKRFVYEDYSKKANVINNAPLSSYADYFE